MTRYPRVIPPGGRGEIEVEIDTKQVRGEFHKKVAVWSSDPERPSLVLDLAGEVKPYVILEPGGYLSLWGKVGSVSKAQIEIINNHPDPFRVDSLEHDLGERIGWSLEEVSPGRLYRLHVEDRSEIPGDYTGRMLVRIGQPTKREVNIIVKGHITEN